MIQPATVPPGQTKYTTAFYTQHLSGSARLLDVLRLLLDYFIPIFHARRRMRAWDVAKRRS